MWLYMMTKLKAITSWPHISGPWIIQYCIQVFWCWTAQTGDATKMSRSHSGGGNLCQWGGINVDNRSGPPWSSLQAQNHVGDSWCDAGSWIPKVYSWRKFMDFWTVLDLSLAGPHLARFYRSKGLLSTVQLSEEIRDEYVLINGQYDGKYHMFQWESWWGKSRRAILQIHLNLVGTQLWPAEGSVMQTWLYMVYSKIGRNKWETWFAEALNFKVFSP